MLGHPTAICNDNTGFENVLIVGECYDVLAIEHCFVAGQRDAEIIFKIKDDEDYILTVEAKNFEFINYMRFADRVIKVDMIKEGKRK